MWILASYQQVTLFSLKPATATSSGGKTLLSPTPFSIKMALLDAAIRTQGLRPAKQFWPLIRDLRVQVRLSPQIIVNNTFAKIVRPKKHGASDDSGTGLMTLFGSTIAYREYVQYTAPFILALRRGDGDMLPDTLTNLLFQVNYMGKRGGFVQFSGLLDSVEDPDHHEFTELTAPQSSFAPHGTLQMLDDCGSKMTFEQADIYSGKRITLGKERVLHHIVLPYQLTRSSRGFSLYERIV